MARSKPKSKSQFKKILGIAVVVGIGVLVANAYLEKNGGFLPGTGDL